MIPLARINGLRKLNSERVTEFLLRHGERIVLIWSAEHRAWWGPGRCGYTTDPREAGVYTLANAYDATSHCGPEKQIHYEFYYPF
jgi:hypothetical protein